MRDGGGQARDAAVTPVGVRPTSASTRSPVRCQRGQSALDTRSRSMCRRQKQNSDPERETCCEVATIIESLSFNDFGGEVRACDRRHGARQVVTRSTPPQRRVAAQQAGALRWISLPVKDISRGPSSPHHSSGTSRIMRQTIRSSVKADFCTMRAFSPASSTGKGGGSASTQCSGVDSRTRIASTGPGRHTPTTPSQPQRPFRQVNRAWPESAPWAF